MSDDRPSSIAEGLYGKDEPISGGPADPRTRAVIDSGIAKPSEERPVSVDPPYTSTSANGRNRRKPRRSPGR